MATEPAVRPAMDSTCAAERPAPAWLEASMGVSYAPGLLHGWGRGATIAWFYGDVGGKERRRGFGRGEKKKREKLEPAVFG